MQDETFLENGGLKSIGIWCLTLWFEKPVNVDIKRWRAFSFVIVFLQILGLNLSDFSSCFFENIYYIVSSYIWNASDIYSAGMIFSLAYLEIFNFLIKFILSESKRSFSK